MSRKQNFDQFDDLIDELHRSDERPSTPRAFKQELRGNLLKQYEERTLSAQANWNLWRFAGGVAGVLLLITTIIGFGQAMSQASTATSTESVEETDFPTVTPDTNSLPLELPRDLGDNILLVGFSISQNSGLASSQFDQLLQVNLSWETTGQPTADYTAFVHLLDANGNLVAQANQSLGETSTFANGTQVDASFDLALPDTPGTYLFTTGLYDSNTGQQLLENNTFQGLALTLFEVPANGLLTQLPAELGDSFRLLDFSLSTNQFVPGQPLQISLSWETTGRPTADYTAFVHLVDQSGNLLAQTDQSLGASSTFVNGTRPNTNLTLWLPDDLPSGTFSIVIGLYDSTTGQQLPADRPGLYMVQIEVKADTAVTSEQCPCVTLISATQYPRTSVDDPITLMIDIAYQLDSDEKVILKPLYTHPDWSTAVDGRLPIDGLGDEIVLDGAKSSFGNETITFVENPAVMRDIVGTDYPVLVMQLRYLDEDGEPTSAVTMEAMPNFTLDLTSTEEVTYQMDMNGFETVPSAMVSGTSGNGLTLQTEPNGQQIGVLEEGSFVLLNDDTLMESEGLLWQSVSTPIGKGWVATDFLDYPEEYTPTDTMPWSPDGLWIVNATQLPRSDPSEAIILEVTVGYELVSAEEAILSLSFIHPEWETHTSLDEIRYPNYNALGDRFPVQPGTGSVTLTATVEPETITSAIGSDEFGLMPRLWAVDENGRIVFSPILMGFNQTVSFNVQSVEKITYP